MIVNDASRTSRDLFFILGPDDSNQTQDEDDEEEPMTVVQSYHYDDLRTVGGSQTAAPTERFSQGFGYD